MAKLICVFIELSRNAAECVICVLSYLLMSLRRMSHHSTGASPAAQAITFLESPSTSIGPWNWDCSVFHAYSFQLYTLQISILFWQEHIGSSPAAYFYLTLYILVCSLGCWLTGGSGSSFCLFLLSFYFTQNFHTRSYTSGFIFNSVNFVGLALFMIIYNILFYFFTGAPLHIWFDPYLQLVSSYCG